MSPDSGSLTLLVALVWFIVYWIFGGVFFAIVVASRFINLRKARFSCLFSIASGVLAYAAATTTLLTAQLPMRACAKVTKEGTDAFLGLLKCAPKAFFASGFLWFAVLVLIGAVAVLLSRAEKRPASH